MPAATQRIFKTLLIKLKAIPIITYFNAKKFFNFETMNILQQNK